MTKSINKRLDEYIEFAESCKHFSDAGFYKDVKAYIEDNSVKNAMDVIKQSMIDDIPSKKGSYAHGWHCNIAMMCYDAILDKDKSVGHTMAYKMGNEAASRFMKLAFDVVTTN